MKWELYKKLSTSQKDYLKEIDSDEIAFLIIFVSLNIIWLSFYIFTSTIFIADKISVITYISLFSILSKFQFVLLLIWMGGLIFNLFGKRSMLKKWGIKK